MRLDTARQLGAANVRDLLLEHRVSDLFLLYPLPAEAGDEQFATQLRSILGTDVALHLWIPVFRNERYLQSSSSDAFVSSPGKVEPGWVNPTSQTYREKLLRWVRQALQKTSPDGIFLDYFYVPYGPFDNQTIARFAAEAGANATYETLIQNRELLSDFVNWRNKKMVQLLADLSGIAKERGVSLSIFVLMFEPSARFAMGQDISRFSPLVDFFVSDTYHVAAKRDAAWVGQGVQALRQAGATSVWAGIQGYEIPAREIGRAIRSALGANADGVVLFRFGTLTDEDWMVIRKSLSKRYGYLWALIPALGIVLGYVLIRRMRATRPSGSKSYRKSRRRPRRKR